MLWLLHNPLMDHVNTSQSKSMVIMWLLVVCAVVLSGASLWVATRPIPFPTPQTPVPQGVSGVAELAVKGHLLTAIAGTHSNPAFDTHTVRVEPAGQGYWAATVMVADPKAFRLWQVTVDSHGPLPQVVGLPALIPVPAMASRPAISLGEEGDPRLRDTISAALSALLTGQPDLDRYIATDANLTAIDPPPFVAVTVTGTSKPMVVDGHVMILAGLEGQRHDGIRIRAHYPLALIKEGDRWLVRAILRAMPPEAYPPPDDTGPDDSTPARAQAAHRVTGGHKTLPMPVIPPGSRPSETHRVAYGLRRTTVASQQHLRSFPPARRQLVVGEGPSLKGVPR